VVLIAQKSVSNDRPFFIDDEEGVIAKDYAARGIPRFDERQSRGLDEEVAVTILSGPDLGALTT